MSINTVSTDVHDKVVNENVALKQEVKETNDLFVRIAVLPYLKMKCKLYSSTWSTTWSKPISLPDNEVPNQLYGQTRERFKKEWHMWLIILLSSPSPSVESIKTKITATYPDMTDRDIAKYFALLQCFLLNAANGPSENLALSFLASSDAIIDALKKWSIDDPVLLYVTKAFEDVTTGC